MGNNIAYKLMVSLGMDTSEYDKKAKDVDGQVNSLGSNLGNKVGKIAKLAGAGIAAVSGAAATAVSYMTKASISNYAEYEQFLGGIESAFKGNQAAVDKVVGLAKNGWKDLTMSEKDYYQSFMSSYPLIKNSIADENEAIQVTNDLMTLNSDLVNTFGYSYETA